MRVAASESALQTATKSLESGGKPTRGLEPRTPSLRVLERCPLQSSQVPTCRLVGPERGDLTFLEVTGDDSVVDPWWTPVTFAGKRTAAFEREACPRRTLGRPARTSISSSS